MASTKSAAPQSEPEGHVFELAHRKTGVAAQAREIDGNFVVLAGLFAVVTMEEQDQGHTHD